MTITTKLGLIAATGALAVAVPAAAKSPHPGDHGKSSSHRSSHSSGSHRCSAHRVAYIASGKIVTWAATAGSDGTYSGTVTVSVSHANHHAAGATGSDVTYTLSGARVRFDRGANPPAAGDRIKLIGKITAIAHRCTDRTEAGTITVRRLVITPAIQHP